eukprot:TRINITY_DN4011_c0_g1_i1.p1 TRINITY_DN4011_c0_g1~~TRINITY_DN4011_c0_g1_i1.p1  ORF type:complete len:211 (+),score=46.22 TRINITY_DN4011_c0_g1_i1:55-687(+)
MNAMSASFYCLSVRTGAYVSIAWSVVYSTFQVAYAAIQINKLGNNSTESASTYPSVLIPGGWDGDVLHHVHLLLLPVYLTVLISCLALILGILTNIAILFLPWLVTTVLATGVEAGIDGWILYRASFTPVTAFIFTFEFFFLLLQVYTVYCTVQLYTQTGLAGQGGGRELQFIKLQNVVRNEKSEKHHVKLAKIVRKSSLSRIVEEGSFQ